MSALAAPRLAVLLLLGGLVGGILVNPREPVLSAAPAAAPTGAVAALPTLTPRPGTVTPTIGVIELAPATPRSTLTPRPVAATPTAHVIELAPATPLSTRTPTPAPSPSPTPSPTPTPPPVVTLTFRAEDWVGGYYRGDRQWYGRTWVAVYGAFSPYPDAALTIPLEATPTGPATVTITGLDDEWNALNPIVILVNGTVLYDGPSPWPNWDGVGHGEAAAWTPATFAIPVGVLQAGANQLVVANRSASANFGLPPYVLLSDATLQAAVP